MSEPHVYDKAKYHIGGKWPRRLAAYQSFVHTGLFFTWLIDRNLLSEEFWEGSEQEIELVKIREMTGPQFYQRNDGVLVDEMLSEDGNSFAHFYFDFDNGQFLSDYEEVLAVDLPTLYHVSDTWENYENLKVRVDQRFADWQKNEQYK